MWLTLLITPQQTFFLLHKWIFYCVWISVCNRDQGFWRHDVFLYLFQKCTLSPSKKCTRKKFLPKKSIFLGLLLGAYFILKNQYEKADFLYSISHIWEKQFSSLRMDKEYHTFWELERLLAFRKTVFNEQILDFHSPFKILCHIHTLSKLWNLV